MDAMQRKHETEPEILSSRTLSREEMENGSESSRDGVIPSGDLREWNSEALERLPSLFGLTPGEREALLRHTKPVPPPRLLPDSYQATAASIASLLRHSETEKPPILEVTANIPHALDVAAEACRETGFALQKIRWKQVLKEFVAPTGFLRIWNREEGASGTTKEKKCAGKGAQSQLCGGHPGQNQ